MYYYEDPAAYKVMTKYLDGQPVSARDSALAWRTQTICARNHRGEYRLHMSSNLAHAYFYPYGEMRGCETLHIAEGVGAVRAVELACDAHAAALPPYPFLFGWPALASEALTDA